MKNPIQSIKRRSVICLAALAATLAIPTGLRAVILDGNVGGLAEGYTNEYDMSFSIAATGGKSPLPGGNPSGGKLYTALNGNVLSVGFIAPLSIDDNLYGTATTADWNGHTHSYSELTGSDAWVLSIKNSAGKVFALNVSYAVPTTDGGTYNGQNINSAITGKSSLDYDINHVLNDINNAPTTGINGANWVKNIEYEWQIDFSGLAGTFTVQDLIDSFNGVGNYFHMSPNKIGANEVYGDTPTPTTPQSGVPDAGSTATLLGLALLGMGAFRRKLRKA